MWTVFSMRGYGNLSCFITNIKTVHPIFNWSYSKYRKYSFWPGLGLPRPKAIVVIPQNQPLPKHLRKKTSKSAKHACHYATKERPVKITMYLGLDIIIKIKFTTIFDRCAILNVLNYLTKNFES